MCPGPPGQGGPRRSAWAAGRPTGKKELVSCREGAPLPQGDKGLRGRRERGARHLDAGLRSGAFPGPFAPGPGLGATARQRLACEQGPSRLRLSFAPRGARAPGLSTLQGARRQPRRADLGARRRCGPERPRAHGSEGHLAPASLGPRKSRLPAGTLPLGGFQRDICGPAVPERMVLTLEKTSVGLNEFHPSAERPKRKFRNVIRLPHRAR